MQCAPLPLFQDSSVYPQPIFPNSSAPLPPHIPGLPPPPQHVMTTPPDGKMDPLVGTASKKPIYAAGCYIYISNQPTDGFTFI